MADLKEFQRKMEKTLDVLASDFAAVRAGRANAQVLDRITVEYYGQPSPINQVGTVSSPDPRTLVIQPWDGSLLKAIEKAIQTSDLGINPQNDGRVIRLVFPQLTEERRKDLTKQVRKYAEDAKVAVRNIRRDAVDYVKKAQKKGELTEDDQKKAEKDIQDLTDKHVKKIVCAVKYARLKSSVTNPLTAPRANVSSGGARISVTYPPNRSSICFLVRISVAAPIVSPIAAASRLPRILALSIIFLHLVFIG